MELKLGHNPPTPSARSFNSNAAYIIILQTLFTQRSCELPSSDGDKARSPSEGTKVAKIVSWLFLASNIHIAAYRAHSNP